MKLAATVARSLKAHLQAELHELELAVENGTREAGRGLKTELRRQVASAELGQRLGNSWRDKHYPNRKIDAATPGLHQGAADHPRVRRGCADPEQARALPGDPDRERAEEGHRREEDQPEHLPGAPLRPAPVRASTKRTIALSGGRLTRLA
jgi:Family of unknown function (DUF6441)